jgi:hypothetical protein
VDGENEIQPMRALDELEAQGRMTWTEVRHGWTAAPHDVVEALSRDGFEECTRVTTPSRQNLQPAGSMWHGVNPRTRSVTSVTWVNQPRRAPALVFITIDGEAYRDRAFSSLERDPYKDDGGES